MIEAAAVFAEPDVPSPQAWLRGRFFPNACIDTTFQWERVGDGPAIRARHLPIMGEVLEARMRFGPAAEPMLAAWRRMWNAAVPQGDVDAYAREREAFATEAPAERRRRLLGRAERALGRGTAATAASHAMEAILGNRYAPVRDTSFHVMEEAATHLALAAGGLPFVIAVASAGGYGFFVPDGKGGLAALPDLDPASSAARAGIDSTRRAGNPYWSMAAFRERAGRGMAMASGLDHLHAILLDMAAQGHAKAFLKGAAGKSGTWVVDIEGVTPEGVADRVRTAVGDHRAELASDSPRRRAMLVQAFTPFVREHRFLVVGGRVAASTPSDRDLSVLDARTHRILRPEVARLDAPADVPGEFDRGASRTEVDRGLVARMARGARDLARALGAEFREGGKPWEARPDCYCIDMGETADGRVLPIEVNTILNCGLYALDVGRLHRAWERRAARRRDLRTMGGPPGERGGRYAGADAPGAQDRGTVPEAELPELVERYVEEAFGGGVVGLALAFSRENEAAITAWVGDASPGIGEFELRRAATFFEPWKEPLWAASWREWLRERGGRRLAVIRPRFGSGFSPAEPCGIVLEVSSDADGIPEAVRAPGPRRWSRRARLPRFDPARPAAAVMAEADYRDIDWGSSLLAQVLGEDDLRAPMVLRPGARVRIVSANVVTQDGYRDADIGALAGTIIDA